MQLLTLQSYPAGFRGCLIDERKYCFFQFRRKDGLKILKSYSKSEFTDLNHFVSMMQKFMTPSAVIRPPIDISDFTFAELERIANQLSLG
jgi:hypothetical protein